MRSGILINNLNKVQVVNVIEVVFILGHKEEFILQRFSEEKNILDSKPTTQDGKAAQLRWKRGKQSKTQFDDIK